MVEVELRVSGELNHILGGRGFALSFTLTNGSYGQGGGVYNSSGMAATGSSGGYNSNYVNVTEGTTYSIVVGAGRTWKSCTYKR